MPDLDALRVTVVGVAGTAVLFQIEQGHVYAGGVAAVVNVQV